MLRSLINTNIRDILVKYLDTFSILRRALQLKDCLMFVC